MMQRRRFLTITCAALGTSAMAAAAPLRWQGIALGAHVTLEMSGPSDITKPALQAALRLIRRVEHLFSLYDPNSLLVRLNQTGRLDAPPADFLHLFAQSDHVHQITQGHFDPTVQVLWRAHANDTSPDAARAHLGWHRLRFDANAIQLAPGQQLTFNGIAQGYATDLVTDALRRAGLDDLHVNIGEHAAFGPSQRLGLSDPEHGLVGTLTLKDSAVATSSPAATRVGKTHHIFSPSGAATYWSTVSVIATRATLADGLSTALCLAPPDVLIQARRLPDVQRVVGVDASGDVSSF